MQEFLDTIGELVTMLFWLIVVTTFFSSLIWYGVTA